MKRYLALKRLEEISNPFEGFPDIKRNSFQQSCSELTDLIEFGWSDEDWLENIPIEINSYYDLVGNKKIAAAIIREDGIIEANVHPSMEALLQDTFVDLTPLGAGRHRTGYLTRSKRYVLKVPKNIIGILANEKELLRYKCGWDYPMAKCRKVPGCSAIIMEYIIQVNLETFPSWAESIDCSQVGLNSHGKYVAYDYAQG